MADRNSNLAVDLARYEARAERANAHRNIRSKAVTAKPSETPAATAAVLLLVAIGILLSACIASKANIAAVHAAIIKQEAEVASLEQENRRMLTELEQKSSQKAVEDYAENVLGMQKLEKSQVEYVSLESGNVVEISEKETNFFTELLHKLDELAEYSKK